MNQMAISHQQAQATAPTLEVVLLELSKFGRPRLSMLSPGEWHSVVEMNTNAPGVESTVRSDYRHRSPTEAAQVCLQRLRASISPEAHP